MHLRPGRIEKEKKGEGRTGSTLRGKDAGLNIEATPVPISRTSVAFLLDDLLMELLIA